MAFSSIDKRLLILCDTGINAIIDNNSDVDMYLKLSYPCNTLNRLTMPLNICHVTIHHEHQDKLTTPSQKPCKTFTSFFSSQLTKLLQILFPTKKHFDCSMRPAQHLWPYRRRWSQCLSVMYLACQILSQLLCLTLKF